MVEDCIFCKVVRGEAPCEEIYENDNFISIPDANQVIDGHSLVISKDHYATTLDMPSSLGMELLDCIKKTAMILIDKHKAEGFNVINNNFSCAGQAVNHVHFHILPRKKGDKVPQLY